MLLSQGGYDLLGRTKDQIRTTEQVNAAMAACKALKLDGLVVIGGIWFSLNKGLQAQGIMLKSSNWYIFSVSSRGNFKHRCCSACRNFCRSKMPNKGVVP